MLTLAATKSLRRLGAAIGRALIVDDVERGGRRLPAAARFGAGADLRAEPRRRAGQRRRDADQQPVGLRAGEPERHAAATASAHRKPRQARHGPSAALGRRACHRPQEVKAADCIGNMRFGGMPGLWRAGLVPYIGSAGHFGNCRSAEEERGRAAGLPRRDGAVRRALCMS